MATGGGLKPSGTSGSTGNSSLTPGNGTGNSSGNGSDSGGRVGIAGLEGMGRVTFSVGVALGIAAGLGGVMLF